MARSSAAAATGRGRKVSSSATRAKAAASPAARHVTAAVSAELQFATARVRLRPDPRCPFYLHMTAEEVFFLGLAVTNRRNRAYFPFKYFP